MLRTAAFVLALASLVGCSSSSTNESAGATGGSAGSSAGGGGSGGVGGGGGVGGSSGSAGSVATGGTAGSSGGAAGTSGQGGTAGQGGGAGAAGSGGGLAATVACGSTAPKCPTNPGRCCFDTGSNAPKCQLAAATCDPNANARIFCDGSEDCASGEVCCMVQSKLGSPTPYKPSVSCQTDCTTSGTADRFQVCDVSQTSPSQCLSGTCKKVVHTTPPNAGEVYELRLPIGYGLCN
jgi:hypothetical protein